MKAHVIIHVLVHVPVDVQTLVQDVVVHVPIIVQDAQDVVLVAVPVQEGVLDALDAEEHVLLAVHHVQVLVQEDAQDVMTSVMLLVSNHVPVVQDVLDAVLLVGQAALLPAQTLVLERVVTLVLHNAEHVVHLAPRLALQIVEIPVQALVMVA